MAEVSWRTTYQPRFLAYCRAYGFTPENAPASNHEFVVWIRTRWRQWRDIAGREAPATDADHIAFDAWLAEWVGGLPDTTHDGEQGSLFDAERTA